MKLILIMFLVALSCSHDPKVAQGKKLNALFENYWEDRNKLFPLEATQQGDNRYNDLLPNDQTKEFRDQLDAFYQKNLNELHQFKRDELNPNDQVSYDIFEYEMNMQLELSKSASWMIPFQQFWGLPLLMGQLASGDQFQPFKTVKDYENWLKRVDAFSVWSDSAIENFRAGMKNGVILPKKLVTKMIPQMKDIVVKDPTKSLFYGPITKMPAEFSDADKKRLTTAYIQTIETKVNPTFKKLADFLSREYLPKSRNTSGIDSVKGGKKLYLSLVKYWTTTNKTPDEIYNTGLAEVDRITKEMEKVKVQVGYKGSLKSFFNHLRTDKNLMPYKTPQEVLNAFAEIHQKIKPHLSSYFTNTPKTPFEIRQTEEFRAASASAEYNQGSPDGKRPGIFYIPIVDAKKFNVTSGMESLFLHEAIPGHHYQISLQQENGSLPRFRRFSWYGAYGEGWALYTESLGRELGLYTNPYQYMGALSDEMHRAIRLVVDVGIHTKGWSREKAIQYMMSKEPISLDGATAEIERYMAIPAQALSYKIGSLKIRELRNKYTQSLGPKFQISRFHDEFLKDGCMPLSLMEAKMDTWSGAIGR